MDASYQQRLLGGCLRLRFMYPEIALPIICHGDVMRYVGLLPVGTTFELVNDNWKQP